MHTYIIAPEHASDRTIRCGHCWDEDATHIEITPAGKHDPDDHLILCLRCADLAGLKVCSWCETGPKVLAFAGPLKAELTCIHASDWQNSKGHRCCHPDVFSK